MNIYSYVTHDFFYGSIHVAIFNFICNDNAVCKMATYLYFTFSRPNLQGLEQNQNMIYDMTYNIEFKCTISAIFNLNIYIYYNFFMKTYLPKLRKYDQIY